MEALHGPAWYGTHLSSLGAELDVVAQLRLDAGDVGDGGDQRSGLGGSGSPRVDPAEYGQIDATERRIPQSAVAIDLLDPNELD